MDTHLKVNTSMNLEPMVNIKELTKHMADMMLTEVMEHTELTEHMGHTVMGTLMSTTTLPSLVIIII